MCRKFNLNSREIKEVILRLESGKETTTSIVKSLGTNYKTFNTFCILNNIAPNKWRRKAQINENFFEKIDTPEKAYLLGFISGDGHISYTKTNKKLNINIQERDVEILEKMADIMEFKGNINYISSPREGWQNQRLISITSKKLVSDLEKLGVTRKKSFTLRFPTNDEVPKHLWKDYIRGLMDADGCVSIRTIRGKRKTSFLFRFNIVGSNLTCQGVADKIKELTGLGNQKIKPHGNIFVFCIEGNKQIKKLYGFLYEDINCICLSRKRDKMKQVFSLSSIPNIPEILPDKIEH